MVTDLFYSHIVNMNRSSLHTKSFRRIHLSVFRYRLVKNGFPGPKSFRGFRETGPWYRWFGIGILASYAPMTMDMNIVCSSIHLIPVPQTNPGSGWNPPSPSQDFSSSSEQSQASSVTHRVINNNKKNVYYAIGP